MNTLFSRLTLAAACAAALPGNSAWGQTLIAGILRGAGRTAPAANGPSISGVPEFSALPASIGEQNLPAAAPAAAAAVWSPDTFVKEVERTRKKSTISDEDAGRFAHAGIETLNDRLSGLFDGGAEHKDSSIHLRQDMERRDPVDMTVHTAPEKPQEADHLRWSGRDVPIRIVENWERATMDIVAKNKTGVWMYFGHRTYNAPDGEWTAGALRNMGQGDVRAEGLMFMRLSYAPAEFLEGAFRQYLEKAAAVILERKWPYGPELGLIVDSKRGEIVGVYGDGGYYGSIVVGLNLQNASIGKGVNP